MRDRDQHFTIMVTKLFSLSPLFHRLSKRWDTFLKRVTEELSAYLQGAESTMIILAASARAMIRFDALFDDERGIDSNRMNEERI